MASSTTATRRSWPLGRLLGWGAAGLLLSAPLIAMQFTSEVQWDETDFIVFGIMLLVVGLAIELAVRTFARRRTQVLVIGATLFAFLWLWAELAVGVFTDWGS